MADRVFITGAGIVSAIGIGLEENFQSLRNSSTGITCITRLNSFHKNEFPCGEVRATDDELRALIKKPRARSYSRTSLMGVLAASEALRHARIGDAGRRRTALVSATTVGGMDRSEVFYRQYLENSNRGRLKDIVTHDCGDSTEVIADHLGIKDFLSTVSTACSSSANAILFGARLIRNGVVERVVAGGSDSLTLFTLNGFNSLMILDRNHCRPFDKGRNGLNLGEGAAYLVLESERAVRKDRKNALCEVRGWGNACDAFHQTASSPEGQGAWMAMGKALETASLAPEDIDYINAHGTGTQNNDLSEGMAIQRIFGGRVPACSSTKAFTGHTLGAAGAVEAVLCVLALMNQCLYPSLNFITPMEELGFRPLTIFVPRVRVRHVMSNSLGFGGSNTSLIFSHA